MEDTSFCLTVLHGMLLLLLFTYFSNFFLLLIYTCFVGGLLWDGSTAP